MTHRSGSPVLAIDASDCFSTESLPRRRIAAVAVSAVSSVASPLPLAAADAHVEILRAETGDRLPLGVQHAYIARAALRRCGSAPAAPRQRGSSQGAPQPSWRPGQSYARGGTWSMSHDGPRAARPRYSAPGLTKGEPPDHRRVHSRASRGPCPHRLVLRPVRVHKSTDGGAARARRGDRDPRQMRRLNRPNVYCCRR